MAGQARTLKAALEHLIGVRVPPDARILCWLVEFAACLTYRCGDNIPILEFWEKILYTLAKPARGGKWDPRFFPGVWNAEFVIGSSDTEQGSAIKTRA